MAKVKELSNVPGQWIFFCPGCQCGHYFKVPPWTFNGDVNKPTVRASILVRSTKLSPEGEAMLARKEYPPAGQSFPSVPMVCHSFVTDGRIQFLGDCTHALKDQTVDLPDMDNMDAENV